MSTGDYSPERSLPLDNLVAGDTPPGLGFLVDLVQDARRAADVVLSDEAKRAQYVDALKNLDVYHDEHPELTSQTGLASSEQSLLQRLETVEGSPARHPSLFTEQVIPRYLSLLSKVPFSILIGRELGHRPAAIAFERSDYTSRITEIDAMLEAGPVYIKADNSYRGDHVTRVTKTSAGDYTVEGRGETVDRVTNLADYRPRRSLDPRSDLLIAEAAIPIAPTEEGRTWEIRTTRPLTADSFAKVGYRSGIGNNIPRDGDIVAPGDVLASVVRAKLPEASADQISQQTERFLGHVAVLADRINALSDGIQLELARSILKPQDLREPERYDELMRAVFSGTFFVADITGVWGQDGNLEPVVIEAQTRAAFPEDRARNLYVASRRSIAGKIRLLQSALR